MSLDHLLFKLINTTLTHPILDGFFPFWMHFQKHPIFQFVVLPLLLFFIYRKVGLKGILILIGGVAVASFCDVLVNAFKPLVARLRPLESDLLFPVILRGPSQGGYSFPSSHAADAFALAGFFIYFSKKWKWLFLFLAFLTAYARVYSGVHFPLDALVGALFGFALGYSCAWLAVKIWMLGLKRMRSQ